MRPVSSWTVPHSPGQQLVTVRDQIKSPVFMVSISNVSINISVSFSGSVVSRVPVTFVLGGGESDGGRKMSPIQNFSGCTEII